MQAPSKGAGPRSLGLKGRNLHTVLEDAGRYIRSIRASMTAASLDSNGSCAKSSIKEESDTERRTLSAPSGSGDLQCASAAERICHAAVAAAVGICHARCDAVAHAHRFVHAHLHGLAAVAASGLVGCERCHRSPCTCAGGSTHMEQEINVACEEMEICSARARGMALAQYARDRLNVSNAKKISDLAMLAEVALLAEVVPSRFPAHAPSFSKEIFLSLCLHPSG